MQLADPSPQSRRDAQIARVHDAVRRALGDGGRRSTGLEVFAERLLALRHVEALGPDVREIRVAPGTVITPLARDEVKRRGIAVRWVSRRDIEAARQRGEWGFAIEGDSGVLTALRRTWLDEGAPWRELPALADAARWVGGASERGAVVLTDEGAVAAWRASQCAGVRAASAESSAAVSRAVQGLGLNLLVIEPAGKPLPFLKQLAATFRAAGAAGPRHPVRGGRAVRIAEVIGRLTLSRFHPSLKGSRFVIALPMPAEALLEGSPQRGEEVIAYDNLGAGPGALIGLSEGREAANPFGKVKTPIDAYCACLIDRINV